MDLDGINKVIKKEMEKQNKTGLAEFEGYSPEEMHHIIHFLFDQSCAVQIKQLSKEEYAMIPILSGVKFLVNYLLENEKIKLTAKGFLPTKIVAELYQQNYFTEEIIESGISKLYKETDSLFVNQIRIIAELSGVVKKGKGILSLTTKGKKCLNNEQNLLEDLFRVYCRKFNWAYYDGYAMTEIGRLGCGFSLILLNKFGNVKMNQNFYAEKYFTAYPMLKENIQSNYSTVEEYVANCYTLRTFDRFGSLFGLVQFERGARYSGPVFVQKTKLFDCVFKFSPANNQ
jgi:hypothetical protein